jgi:hypothetical protein
MASRMQALQNQYESGTGKPKDFRFLSQQSQQILKKLGTDIDTLDPTSGVENSPPIELFNQYPGKALKGKDGSIWSLQNGQPVRMN